MFHSPGSIITSGKLRRIELNAEASSAVTPFLPVTLGAGVRFEVQSKECAILVLPEGASRQRLLAIQTFRAHVQKHAQQWYTFAQDRVPPQGSLFVVTGCDKAASWGIATVASRSGSISTSLKFSVAGTVEGSLTPSYEWRDFGSATVRTSRNFELPRTENQCIFIEGFVVPREAPRLAVMQKVLRGFRTERKEVTRESGGHLGREREVKLEKQSAVDASTSRAGIIVENESEDGHS
ncbi:hypothetical protein C8J57DRAFT_1391778 [Mycena rebaudengoi]|nr:hypothetical protein C8J57DRAFT_1391778 [Mycena rebaudengoi]